MENKMLVNKLKSALIAAAAAGAMLMGPGVTTASAVPVSMTWNPSNVGLSTEGQFTFNNITTQDYSSIFLSPGGAPGTVNSTDAGFLPLVAFNNPGPQFIAGLDGNPGATAFGLYLSFTGTDVATCTSAGNCTGQFTSLTYQLMGDPGYNTTFGFAANGTAVANGTGTDILLASGSLALCRAPSPECQNTANISNGDPSAADTLTFAAAPGKESFFVAPPLTFSLNLLGSFINNTSEVVCYAATAAECAGTTYAGPVPAGAPAGSTTLLQLGNPTPGGGSLTAIAATVPEPATLGMFGFGLLGLGLFRNRRKQQA
jgi:hypothetical protein